MTSFEQNFRNSLSPGLVCSAEGSPRRCGGQGDLLAGSMSVFTAWAHKTVQDTDADL